MGVVRQGDNPTIVHVSRRAEGTSRDTVRVTPERIIHRDIRWAKELDKNFGAAMAGDREIEARRASYGAAIGKTVLWMQRLGVTAFCARCARQGSGSCCFAGVENQYDYLLLLLNLLLGGTIPDFQEMAGKCFFVGPHGCKLRARHYYCRKYMCPELLEFLGPEGSAEILEVVGAELLGGWELERAVGWWLRGRS